MYYIKALSLEDSFYQQLFSNQPQVFSSNTTYSTVCNLRLFYMAISVHFHTHAVHTDASGFVLHLVASQWPCYTVAKFHPNYNWKCLFNFIFHVINTTNIKHFIILACSIFSLQSIPLTRPCSIPLTRP